MRFNLGLHDEHLALQHITSMNVYVEKKTTYYLKNTSHILIIHRSLLISPPLSLALYPTFQFRNLHCIPIAVPLQLTSRPLSLPITPPPLALYNHYHHRHRHHHHQLFIHNNNQLHLFHKPKGVEKKSLPNPCKSFTLSA